MHYNTFGLFQKNLQPRYWHGGQKANVIKCQQLCNRKRQGNCR